MKIIIIALSLLSFNSFADCAQSQVGSTYKISLDQIHPTQFSLGMTAIKKKRKEVEKQAELGELKNYLRQKIAPAIVGPDCKYYITDRHHTSYSILKARILDEQKNLYVKIKNDWSKMSFKKFANKMVKAKNVWLKDKDHNLRSFFELPNRLEDLEDDYYRSLAYRVCKKTGFKKINVDYLEFYWAEFFKEEGIILNSSSKRELKSVLDKALELAGSQKASYLPGFIPKG